MIRSFLLRAFFIVWPICAVTIAHLKADTLDLSSNRQVTGTVTKYANYSFEVRTSDGTTANYAESSVRRIAFDSGSAPAKFTTRNNGIQEGTVAIFENGAFNVTTAAGVRQFPIIFVERATFVADRGRQIEIIDHGAEVDIAKHLALGNVTIIDFYADWCGPCKQIQPTLEQMAATDPEIAVRKIDIVDWKTPVVKQFGIHAIPQVNVYNRTGQLVGTVVGTDLEKVKRYVTQAKTSG